MNTLALSENTAVMNQPVFGADLFARWIAFLDATPRTVETYRRNIQPFGRFLSANGITQPRREHVLAFKAYLMETYKPATVSAYLAPVRLLFQWLEAEGLYTNITHHIKGAKPAAGHKKDALTQNQARGLLNSVEVNSLHGLRDYALLAVLLTTGIRAVSAAAANIGDIRNIGGECVLFYRGKGHAEADTFVKLASPVEKAVREYLKARGNSDANAPLFASISNHNHNGRMTTRSISRLVKSHLVDSGLNSDRLTCHSTRHTAATLALLSGASIQEAQQMLGHRNVATTLIYSHNLSRIENQSENRIAGMLFN